MGYKIQEGEIFYQKVDKYSVSSSDVWGLFLFFPAALGGINPLFRWCGKFASSESASRDVVVGSSGKIEGTRLVLLDAGTHP